MRPLRSGVFRSRSGNAAIIFAILAPVLILVAGGAIDVTQASMRQAQLQQAADAAAIGSVARTSPGYLYAVNQLSASGPVPDSITLTNTQALFTANWNSPKDTTTPTITGTSCGGSTFVCKQTTASSVVTVSSVITASATFTTNFLQLIGHKTIQINAVAQASDNIPLYVNFNLLLDNTPSMGIAATTAGITTMVNNTPDQCAFACHDLNNNNNYYNLAQRLGVNTRIYNVAQAAKNLLQTAQSTETANGISKEFSVAVYDFGAAAGDPSVSSYTGFNQVYPIAAGTTTTDLNSAATAAATVDLMTVQGQDQFNDEDTSLNAPLNYAAQYLTASGNGASAAAPQQVLFFVSDGVTDTYNCSQTTPGAGPVGSCRSIVPIDTTACSTLKSNGVKIAVLYTTYLPLPTNTYWQTYVAKNLQAWFNPWTGNPPNDQIAANMQSCASPGLYFEVNASGDINTAMNALFQKVIASVKITS